MHFAVADPAEKLKWHGIFGQTYLKHTLKQFLNNNFLVLSQNVLDTWVFFYLELNNLDTHIQVLVRLVKKSTISRIVYDLPHTQWVEIGLELMLLHNFCIWLWIIIDIS